MVKDIFSFEDLKKKCSISLLVKEELLTNSNNSLWKHRCFFLEQLSRSTIKNFCTFSIVIHNHNLTNCQKCFMFISISINEFYQQRKQLHTRHHNYFCTDSKIVWHFFIFIFLGLLNLSISNTVSSLRFYTGLKLMAYTGFYWVIETISQSYRNSKPEILIRVISTDQLSKQVLW